MSRKDDQTTPAATPLVCVRLRETAGTEPPAKDPQRHAAAKGLSADPTRQTSVTNPSSEGVELVDSGGVPALRFMDVTLIRRNWNVHAARESERTIGAIG